MGGRPRLPTAVKKLKGTLQPCRTNPEEPTLEPAVPEIDLAHLSPTAQKIWPQLSAILLNMGVLTEADGLALTAMAEAFADMMDCKKLVLEQGRLLYMENANGNITIRANPLVGQAADAERRFWMWATQFGLTPASRSKVSASLAKSAGNEFEALLEELP